MPRLKRPSKPEFGLESTDFQLGLFDSMSPKDQESMSKSSSHPIPAAKQLKAIRDRVVVGQRRGVGQPHEQRHERLARRVPPR